MGDPARVPPIGDHRREPPAMASRRSDRESSITPPSNMILPPSKAVVPFLCASVGKSKGRGVSSKIGSVLLNFRRAIGSGKRIMRHIHGLGYVVLPRSDELIE